MDVQRLLGPHVSARISPAQAERYKEAICSTLAFLFKSRAGKYKSEEDLQFFAFELLMNCEEFVAAGSFAPIERLAEESRRVSEERKKAKEALRTLIKWREWDPFARPVFMVEEYEYDDMDKLPEAKSSNFKLELSKLEALEAKYSGVRVGPLVLRDGWQGSNKAGQMQSWTVLAVWLDHLLSLVVRTDYKMWLHFEEDQCKPFKNRTRGSPNVIADWINATFPDEEPKTAEAVRQNIRRMYLRHPSMLIVGLPFLDDYDTPEHSIWATDPWNPFGFRR